jgi:orotate phosphoribosyltransferase
MTALQAPADQIALHVRLGDPASIATMIAQTNAVDVGHFELLGGAHSDSFIRFSRVAANDAFLDLATAWLLPTIAAWSPEVVMAPTTAGVALGATIAKRLGASLALADVGEDGRPAAIRNPDQLRGRRTLLVNDVVTTGASLAALERVAEDAGATVVGAACFINRSPVDVGHLLRAPAVVIADIALPAWPSDECP